MANFLRFKARMLPRIGVTAAALMAITMHLSGQDTALIHEAPATPNRPFARYDAALTLAADSYLAPAAEPAPAARAKVAVTEAAGANRAPRNSPRFLPMGSARNSATARVELLRPAVEPILQSHGIPTNIATAIMLVESGGRTDALSVKGARGLWQLMPETARRYGLRVDEIQDDRLDLSKATGAAANYLHDLYARFGDWRLALAAYNTGENNVSMAMLRAHSQDFDRLASLRMLPEETRDYVSRVIATMNVLGAISVPEDSRRWAGSETVFAVNGQ